MSEFDLQKLLKNRPFMATDLQEPILVPTLVCVDGFNISVQASRMHYCTPRENEGPYSHFEIGFPSAMPPDYWSQFAEDWSSPLETVYGYVPEFELKILLAAHGGVDIERTNELIRKYSEGQFYTIADNAFIPPSNQVSKVL